MKTKKIIIITILLVFAGVISISLINRANDNTPGDKQQSGKKASEVKILNNEQFKSLVYDYEQHEAWKYEGEKPAVIEFYADWCAPCKRMAPVLDELSATYAGNVHIYKINVDKEQTLASVFGVRSIPSFLFVPVNGKPYGQRGFMSKSMLVTEIDKLLN